MNIIPYEKKYRDDVRNVCFETTVPYYRDKKELLFLTYCDYYIDRQEHTYIAVDGDRAVGYVMAAEADDYLKTFKTSYMPKIKAISRLKYLEAKASIKSVRKYQNDYDYHLHIDILPEYQRKGLGHALVDALCAGLKEAGARGVFLCVGANNEKGVGFYKKYGFKVLEKNRYCVTFGIAFGADAEI